VIFDLEAQAILNEVFLVGSSKPLGMLSENILEACGSSPKAVLEWAYRQKLQSSFWVYDVDGKEARLVVVWDEKLLQEIFALNESFLVSEGWPVETKPFLARIVKELSTWDALPGQIVGALLSEPSDCSRSIAMPEEFMPLLRGFRGRLWNGSIEEHELRRRLS